MILLDTCALLWLVDDQGQLSAKATERIAASAGEIFISAITGFEIAIKHRKRKLTLPMEPRAWIDEALRFHGVQEVPVDWRIAASSAELPALLADPCDRIIVATAEARGLVILTPDLLIAAYESVEVLW